MSRSDRDRLLDILEATAAIAGHLRRGPLTMVPSSTLCGSAHFNTSHTILQHTIEADLPELTVAARALLERSAPPA